MADTDALAALRGSIALQIEVEGPVGGAATLTALDGALAYYNREYSKFTPSVLATEVHRVRTLVAGLLSQQQPDVRRRDLRRNAGWLSALLGNLTYHLNDPGAAKLHLETATSLGSDVGDTWLVCWTFGARAMVAHARDDCADAAALALQAVDLADTRLRRAQMLTWALL